MKPVYQQHNTGKRLLQVNIFHKQEKPETLPEQHLTDNKHGRSNGVELLSLKHSTTKVRPVKQYQSVASLASRELGGVMGWTQVVDNEVRAAAAAPVEYIC